jgi:hypothetical protein
MEPQAAFVGVTERDVVLALMRVETDLQRALRQRPDRTENATIWSSTVSTLLMELARGRLYLERLQHALGAAALKSEVWDRSTAPHAAGWHYIRLEAGAYPACVCCLAEHGPAMNRRGISYCLPCWGARQVRDVCDHAEIAAEEKAS